MAKIKKFLKDFTVAYVPYTVVAVIIGFMIDVMWWKVCLLMLSAILVNMFVNVVTVILSTFRFKVITDFLRRRK
jgi:uncharacterized protein YacL